MAVKKKVNKPKAPKGISKKVLRKALSESGWTTIPVSSKKKTAKRKTTISKKKTSTAKRKR